MLEYLFIVIIIVSLVIIGYSLVKMYNDIDLFKKIVIYDQVKKKELINNNAEEIKNNIEEIKNSKDALNAKINTDMENTVQRFNIHTYGLNDLTNYIYAKDICGLNSNKVRNSNNAKLSESELDSLNDTEKNINRICCNNPDVSVELKDNNFSCYPKESFSNYKNIEKFSEDDTRVENADLIEPELEDAEEIINTENIPMPEPTETTLNNSKLLVSDFTKKLSSDGKTPYDGLSIPGNLKISKKNGAIVHIDGKNTRLCGTGIGRTCSYFPYKNNNTYIRPGKKKGNIYVTHAKYFKAKNNSNGLCGTGSKRMCSYFPYNNKHTYIRPGEDNNNIFIGGTKKNSDKTNQVVINSINPLRAISGINIDNGKKLCIGKECLTKDDIEKIKKFIKKFIK
jgi:hypothetical protein